MTVQGCIEYVDSIEPNAYTAEQKAGWLSECEGKVYTSLFLVQPYEFTPVTASDSRTLALPAPYDRMYPRYLQAMIHYANGEYDRYANSMAAFNEVWAEANRWFGGDYDVTDRLRNRRVMVPLNALISGRNSLSDVPICDIPPGCAIVAGRINVKRPMIVQGFEWENPEAMAAGTYHFRVANGWNQFTTTANHAAGSKIQYSLDYPDQVDILGGGHEACTLSIGSDGTEIDPYTPINILINDQSICVLDPTIKGTTALPMIMADDTGDGLRIEKESFSNWTRWTDAGSGSEVYFAGHLLIPDQEWAYEDRYSRRRDARWHG